jgi:hypothetical protein
MKSHRTEKIMDDNEYWESAKVAQRGSAKREEAKAKTPEGWTKRKN